MRRILTYIKIFSIAGIALITFSSCSAYYSETASMDEALNASLNIKKRTPAKDTYKFKKINQEEAQVYDITKRNSFTAKDLNGQIIKKKSDQKEISI